MILNKWPLTRAIHYSCDCGTATLSILLLSCLNTRSQVTKVLCEQGTLKGFDQTINLILDDSYERVYSASAGVEQVILGLYIVRGDSV